jgi:hypothetical protein
MMKRAELMKRLTAALGATLFATTALATNGANDYLLSAKPNVQAATLAKAVGGNCQGQTAFYMGVGKSGISQGKGFWSVRCTDGRPFMVQVNPDGTSSVLECSVLKRLNAGTCFKAFAD